ncbi:MAG: hypothetical protein IPK17_38835 [Chloroflexi bacterium]|uniref:hypothetical protein n=1 Tax=Candidatus Flexifilum breve TaxID=3140694 RepID=UPI0031374868|nr:hypothetical protein [Chloroflexota bacterium]
MTRRTRRRSGASAGAKLRRGLVYRLYVDSDGIRRHHAKQRRRSRTVGDVPFLGFRSHGVLSRLQGQTAGHYECSVGTFIFPK